MAISAEAYFGGSIHYAFSATTNSISWGRTHRVWRMLPSAIGKTVTLPVASQSNIPFGPNIWVMINVADGIKSFTVEDAEGTFSQLIGVGQGCKISKYLDENGDARFSIDPRNQLPA